jgi:hypothetical protein
LVSVKGVVTLDGEPLAGATVLFLPEDNQGRPAQGLTAKDGTFHLATGSENGAAPGTYKVLVTKTEGVLPPGATPAPPSEGPGLEPSEKGPRHTGKALKSLVPPQYSNPSATPFQCRVPPEAPVVLELKSGQQK